MFDYLGCKLGRYIISLLRFFSFLIQKLGTMTSRLEIGCFIVTDGIHLSYLETRWLCVSFEGLIGTLNPVLCRLLLRGSGHGILESGLGHHPVVDAPLLLVLRRLGEFLDDGPRSISGPSDSLLGVVEMSRNVIVNMNTVQLFSKSSLFSLSYRLWTVNGTSGSATRRLGIQCLVISRNLSRNDCVITLMVVL